jgi:peptide/nickel transport system permease protein
MPANGDVGVQNIDNTGIKQNRAKVVWRQYCKNKGAIIGLFVLLFIIFIAIFSNVIWDYETDVIGMNPVNRLRTPDREYPFGTDNFGRDMLARVGYGTRYSLIIGVSSVLFSLLIGLPIGASAGYIGGKYDGIIMRFLDSFDIIPNILLSITIVAALGASITNLTIALSVSSIPILARITRASVMTVRFNDYIESAKALNGSSIYIIFKHVLPNCFSPILVQCTLRIGITIVSASSLSFVGLGVPLPTPEWGALLNASRAFIIQAPYLTVIPGLAIMITVMAINLVGDGLRDALDPKLMR